MKNLLRFIFPISLIVALGMSGCGTAQPPIPTDTNTQVTEVPATATLLPTQTATPDLCAPEHIQAEVDKIHRHMREFDDASILASSTPRDQLSSSIADLQRIRRSAEDEVTVPCLENLKRFQIQHMNSVIDTLIAFLSGTDQAVLDQGISVARQQHDQYTLELARILGITVVPATPAIVPSPTPTP